MKDADELLGPRRKPLDLEKMRPTFIPRIASFSQHLLEPYSRVDDPKIKDGVRHKCCEVGEGPYEGPKHKVEENPFVCAPGISHAFETTVSSPLDDRHEHLVRCLSKLTARFRGFTLTTHINYSTREVGLDFIAPDLDESVYCVQHSVSGEIIGFAGKLRSTRIKKGRLLIPQDAESVEDYLAVKLEEIKLTNSLFTKPEREREQFQLKHSKLLGSEVAEIIEFEEVDD